MRTSAQWLAIFAMAIFVGCSGEGDYREVNEADMVPVPEEHHHHEAPHGGLLVEVGSHEYNVEFIVAEAEPQLTMYVLGAHAERPAAANVAGLKLMLDGPETAVEIALTAAPQEGEAEGTASQFTFTGALPENIKASKDLHGDLEITIGEKSFDVHIHADAHGDHDHGDHGHEHGDHEHKE